MSTSGGDILQEEEEKGTILLVQEAPDEWHRTYAGLLYVMTCITSLAIHTIFVAGIRKLCGWKSNFSFTLLLILSLMCMMRFLCDLVGSMAAVLRVEWENYDILWIGLGSFAWASCYTVIILNTVIAFHRLACTAFPVMANKYLSKFVLQMTLAAIVLFFIGFVIVMNTNLLGVLWANLQMTWMIMTSRNPDVFFLFNSISNYCIGVINPLVYLFLFIILWQRRHISFTRNHEIKLTLQVLCMATCELVFFLYWQFANVEDYDMWAAVIAEISNLLHYDALILPYLLMNKQIHSQLKSIWRKNVVHVVPIPLIKGNVRAHIRHSRDMITSRHNSSKNNAH